MAKLIVMSCIFFVVCDNRIKYIFIVVQTPLPEAGEHPEEWQDVWHDLFVQCSPLRDDIVSSSSDVTDPGLMTAWPRIAASTYQRCLVWLILFPDLILIRLNAATRCYAEGFYASGVSYNRERTARTWQPCNHFIILMGGQLYGSNDDMTLEICWIAPISDWMEINTEENKSLVVH